LFVYVVLLAMVAGFLAVKLYTVLGKRTGHEQVMSKPAEPRLPATVARPSEPASEPREAAAPRPLGGGAEAGVRAIVAHDPSFDVSAFLDGAREAYRMILDAFWKGDEAQLAWLVEDAALAEFREAIAARAEVGHVLDNRLVAIERAAIVDAGLEGGVARITVRFDADIAAVTRDADGQVVAGSTDDAVATHDLWTFARTLKSADPNWKLADTDEA
jgi:predicted lipid-binding transport protein (Tim44 family)